jgi:tRNA dimethylallyltransferase
MAARLEPADTQRVVRALEVIEQTGRSLAEWQRDRSPPVLDEAQTVELLLTLDRSEIQARADARFETMMAEGALQEAQALAGLGIDPSLPAMRAIGVRPLIAAIEGKCSLEEAAAAAKQETRHYVKRQETWFKSHMISWHHINAKYMASNIAEIFAFIQR